MWAFTASIYEHMVLLQLVVDTASGEIDIDIRNGIYNQYDVSEDTRFRTMARYTDLEENRMSFSHQ